MGGTNSSFLQVQGTDNQPLYLPFPETFRALETTENTIKTRKRGRDHDALEEMRSKYEDFVNSPSQIYTHYINASWGFEEYVRKCWEHFKPLIGSNAELFHLNYNSGRTSDLDGIRDHIREARAQQQPVTVLVSITLNAPGICHANTAVLTYDPITDTLHEVRFEPHARRSLRVEYTIITEDELVDLQVFHHTPYTHMGLQKINSKLCTQWSTIMLLTYMINCTGGETCKKRQLNNQVHYLFRNQNYVMPRFLFYTSSFHNYPPVQWGRFGPNHDAFEYDTEIDVHKCAISVECDQYPCVRLASGNCVNSKLFEVVPGFNMNEREFASKIIVSVIEGGNVGEALIHVLAAIGEGTPHAPSVMIDIFDKIVKFLIENYSNELAVHKLPFIGVCIAGCVPVSQYEVLRIEDIIRTLKHVGIDINQVIETTLNTGKRINPSVILKILPYLSSDVIEKYASSVGGTDRDFKYGTPLYNKLEKYHAQQMLGVPRALHDALLFIVTGKYSEHLFEMF